ncbi:MAG: outer membrane protein assembly factor BamB [Pseudomonadota bacterium]
MRNVTRVSFLCLTLQLAGCGTGKYINQMMGDVDNAIPPTPLTDVYTTIKIASLWSEDIGSGTNELYIKLIPNVIADSVFIADTDGELAALDAKSGKKIWQKDLKLPVTGGPGANGNLVMVGSSEGDVVTLTADNGEEIWRSKVSSEILSPPVENSGTVIARTIDGKIFALNAETGERLWVYDRTVPALTLRGTSTPVMIDENVIAGFDGGRVTSLNRATGKLNWETRVAISRGRSELERLVDIDAQPLIYQDAIYIATYQSIIAALSLDTGTVLWEREISSFTELDADENYLFVTDEEGSVWALDRFSGASIWKQEKLLHRKPTGPAVFGSAVVVGDLEGYLHWMDKESGEFIGRTQMSSSPILVKPSVENDQLFAYASDGTLTSYSYIGIDISALPERPEAVSAEQGSAGTTQETASDDSSIFDGILDIFTGGESDDEVDDSLEDLAD